MTENTPKWWTQFLTPKRRAAFARLGWTVAAVVLGGVVSILSDATDVAQSAEMGIAISVVNAVLLWVRAQRDEIPEVSADSENFDSGT